jgi:hypothetical protein
VAGGNMDRAAGIGGDAVRPGSGGAPSVKGVERKASKCHRVIVQIAVVTSLVTSVP